MRQWDKNRQGSHVITRWFGVVPGVRFSKPPKIVGPISGAIISYLSQKRKPFQEYEILQQMYSFITSLIVVKKSF